MAPIERAEDGSLLVALFELVVEHGLREGRVSARPEFPGTGLAPVVTRNGSSCGHTGVALQIVRGTGTTSATVCA